MINNNLVDLSQYTVDDGPEYGVYVRFAYTKKPRSKNKQLNAYWTTDFAQEFTDAKSFGNIKPIEYPGSQSFLNLIKDLITKERYVHIYVENSTIAKDPTGFKKLEQYLNRYKKNRGDLNWEFGDPVRKSDVTNIQPKTIPTSSEINPQRKKEYQQELLNAIRADKELYAKYSSVDNNTRIEIQNAGLQLLAKGVDSFSVVQDLKDMLSTNSNISENYRIRKIINLLNRLES